MLMKILYIILNLTIRAISFYPADKSINLLINNVSLKPYEYEPNDTMEQAYPYSRMYTHHEHPFVDARKACPVSIFYASNADGFIIIIEV